MMHSQQKPKEVFPVAAKQEYHPKQSGTDYQTSKPVADTFMMADFKPCFMQLGEHRLKDFISADCQAPKTAADALLMAQVKPCFVQLTDVGRQLSPERSQELCSPVLEENSVLHPSDSKDTIKVMCNSSPVKPCFVKLTDVESPCFKGHCSELKCSESRGTKRKLPDLGLCNQSKGHIVDPDPTFIKPEPLDPDYPETVPLTGKLKENTVNDNALNIASVQIVPYPLALFQNVHTTKTGENSVRKVKRHLPKKCKIQRIVSSQKTKGRSTLTQRRKVKREPEITFQEQTGLDRSLNLPQRQSGSTHSIGSEFESGVHFQPENGQDGHFLAENGHSKSLDQNQNSRWTENVHTECSDQKPSLKMGKLPFVCPVCSERFLDANLLVTHSRTRNHFAKTYHCSICSASFAMLSAYESHVCTVKYKRRRFVQCDFCAHKFKNRALLEQHIAKHKGELPYQCVICSRSWSSEKLLYLHIKRNHRKVCLSTASFAEQDLLYCSICSAAFWYISALKSHAASHRLDRKMDDKNGNDTNLDKKHGDKTVTSETGEQIGKEHEKGGCVRNEDEKDGMNRQVNENGEDCHLHLSHPPVCDGTERPFRCSKCPSAFSAKPLLMRHFNYHHKKKPYQCPYCTKDYPTPQGLRDHARDHIYEGKTLYCYKCDRYFDTLSSLSTHNTNAHRKVIKCPKCPCKFARKHNLKKHLQRHKTQKYFFCPQCQRKFKEHPLLLKHVKNHEEKKYMCCKCLSLHSTLHNLKRHFRSHRGEICYLCSHCPQSFSTLAEVQEHIKSHTEKPPSSQDTAKTCPDSGGLKLVFRRTDQNTFTCSLPGKCEEKTDSSSLAHSLEQEDEQMIACDSTEPNPERVNDCCFDSDTVQSAPDLRTGDTESHHLCDSQTKSDQLDDTSTSITDKTDGNVYSDAGDEDTYTDAVSEEDEKTVNSFSSRGPATQLCGGSSRAKMGVNAFSPVVPSTHLRGGHKSAKCIEDENSDSQETSENDEDEMDANDDNTATETDATSNSSHENTLLDSSCQNMMPESKHRSVGPEDGSSVLMRSDVYAETATNIDTKISAPNLASTVETSPSTPAAKTLSLRFSHYEKPEAGKPGVVSRVVPETPLPSKTPAQRSETSKVRQPQYNAKTELKLLRESQTLASIFNDPSVRGMFSESFKNPVSLSERKACQKRVILLVKPVEKSGKKTSVHTSSSSTASAQSGGCFRVKYDPGKQDFEIETVSYPDESFSHNVSSTVTEKRVSEGSSVAAQCQRMHGMGSSSQSPTGPFGRGDPQASGENSLNGTTSVTECHPDLVKVEGQPGALHGNWSSAQGQQEVFHAISASFQHSIEQGAKQPNPGQGQENICCPSEPSTQLSGGHSGSKLVKVLLESDAKYNQQTQTSIEYTLYQCAKCSSVFRSMSAVKVHMRTHRTHRCPKCSHIFKTYAQLMQHLKTHGEKAYRCSQCSAAFTYPSDLRIHQRIHSGEKPYKCAHCPREFKSMSELNSHKKTHSEEKPFTCSECPSSFRRLSDLKVHSRIHSGEKPYLCSECASAFKSVGELKSHAKVHTQDKPFKCSECPSAFRSASDLKVHTRTHTGERPFLCSQCPWAFKSVGELKSHERRTHKDSAPSKSQ